jgi:two-component system chemotaxis response regulator CheB
VVLAQDAATSAVWGMPGRVFDAGLVREPLPLAALAGELTRRVSAGRIGRVDRDTAAKTTMASQRNGNAVSAPRPEVLHGLL